MIGRNEAKTIKKTIESIYGYVSFNDINAYEIIYVDSKSTDNSLEIVQKFKEVKIFEITGEISAAIGRNIGAKEAKGDVFVFLDADMEIEKTFHDAVFENNKLIYPFVSGQLKNIFYNEKWELIDENFQFSNLKEDKFVATTGGYFIIEKELWDSVKGMKTKYQYGEDLDLGLRLAKKGTLLLRKKELFVIHHTIDYQNEVRMWKKLLNGDFLYTTSVLYRDHLLNKYNIKSLLRKDYSLIILLIILCISLFFPKLILFYILILVIRVAMQKKVSQSSGFGKTFIFFLLKDFMAPFGFIFFFPQNKVLEYNKVQ